MSNQPESDTDRIVEVYQRGVGDGYLLRKEGGRIVCPLVFDSEEEAMDFEEYVGANNASKLFSTATAVVAQSWLAGMREDKAAGRWESS